MTAAGTTEHVGNFTNSFGEPTKYLVWERDRDGYTWRLWNMPAPDLGSPATEFRWGPTDGNGWLEWVEDEWNVLMILGVPDHSNQPQLSSEQHRSMGLANYMVLDAMWKRMASMLARSNPRKTTSTAEFRKLFAIEKKKFAKIHPRVAKATLVIVDRKCSAPGWCRPRDLAYAQYEPNRITFLRRALVLPYDNLVAVLRHELGHLSDKRLNDPGAEKRADRIAERATGEKIRYDKQQRQTIGPGTTPRPRNLHQ